MKSATYAIVKVATTQQYAKSIFVSGSTWQSAQCCQKINESAIFKAQFQQFGKFRFKLRVSISGKIVTNFCLIFSSFVNN